MEFYFEEQNKTVKWTSENGKEYSLTTPINYEYQQLVFYEEGTSCMYTPRQIMYNPSISASARLVYSILTGLKWCKSNAVCGNIGTISRTSGLSRNTTKKCLDELERLNIIKMEKYQYEGRTSTFITFKSEKEWNLPQKVSVNFNTAGRIVESVS